MFNDKKFTIIFICFIIINLIFLKLSKDTGSTIYNIKDTDKILSIKSIQNDNLTRNTNLISLGSELEIEEFKKQNRKSN